jgi:RimJ/RimL family protein N-acetyltransferase
MLTRKTTAADLDRVMEVLSAAREAMREAGNTVQWVNGYPSRELIESDIERGVSYVIENEGRLVASFAFILGDDPTYAEIDGAWLNERPYGTIHRIGSDGSCRGVMGEALRFCSALCPNIRIDTHESNARMRAVLKKQGFAECGTIYIEDGTPRIAFQKLYE